MASERPAEISVVQQVEAFRDELHTEQRALEGLPQGTARLREQIERLQAQRESLHGELAALRQEEPAKPPQLPPSLALPFTVKVQQGWQRLLLTALFSSAYLVLLFPLMILPLALALLAPAFWGAVGGFASILRPPRWRFDLTRIEPVGFIKYSRKPVSYKAIRDVKVLVTRPQKRRGVGTLMVTCWGEESPVLLSNVPEPERLAEWLRSMPDVERAASQQP